MLVRSMSSSKQNLFRKIPAIEALLGDPELLRGAAGVPRKLLVGIVRKSVDQVRKVLATEKTADLDADAFQGVVAFVPGDLLDGLATLGRQLRDVPLDHVARNAERIGGRMHERGVLLRLGAAQLMVQMPDVQRQREFALFVQLVQGVK